MYSHYNEDTRYTQGMSTLAAILLIYFPDEIVRNSFERLLHLVGVWSFRQFVRGLQIPLLLRKRLVWGHCQLSYV